MQNKKKNSFFSAEQELKAYEEIARDLERIRKLWRRASRPEREGKKARVDFDKIKSWKDEDEAARALAKECYEKAQEFLDLAKQAEDPESQQPYIKLAAKWMAMVQRFMRLSHLSKKELDIEEIQKQLHELRAQQESE